MNFVFKKEHGEVDAWLASMDEASMEKSIGEAALAKVSIYIFYSSYLHSKSHDFILKLNILFLNIEARRCQGGRTDEGAK